MRTLALLIVAAATIGLSAVASSEPQVAPSTLPNPTLPPWIVQIAPLDSVTSLSQIRIRFKNPIIPLEALESPDEQRVLAHFVMTPKLPGRFRFVTPHMVIFEEGKALPNAIRVRITLTAGLGDLSGNHLGRDLSWTFSTEPISIDLPSNIAPWSLDPKLDVVSNTALDLESLRAKTSLTDGESGRPIAVSIDPIPEQRWCYFEPLRAFDPSIQSYEYIVAPRGRLAKDHPYQLTIGAGVVPHYGNIPSADPVSDTYRTYAPLAFRGLFMSGGASDDRVAPDRFVDGTAHLTFNNGLDSGSMQRNIVVSHVDVKPAELFGLGPDFVAINPWHLAPNAHYVVTMTPQLTDEWGQQLGKTITVSFETSDIAPQFSALSKAYVFPATLGFKLLADVVTLPQDRYQAAFAAIAPTDLVYNDFRNGGYFADWEAWQWSHVPPRDLPPIQSWPVFTVAGTRSTPTLVDLDLNTHLGASYGVLRYGMTARIPGTLLHPPDSLQVAFGDFNVTNLGLFAQVTPHEAIALVHRLSDGAPVPDASVEFYLRRADEPGAAAPQPCATARTDSGGEALLDLAAIRACLPWRQPSSTDSYGANVLVVARAVSDWTYVRIGSVFSTYSNGLGWSENAIESHGAFFSDRGLYQPGEKASFVAYAFYLQDDAIHRDAHQEYRLKLVYPDGTSRDEGPRTTNEYGSFSYDAVLPRNAAVGTYTLTAIRRDGVLLQCTFQVAEFKAPNFKVGLRLDRHVALAGETVTAIGDSEYLFGRQVDKAKTHLRVLRSLTDFTPKGWESFSFRRSYWPSDPPQVDSKVLDVDGITDVRGKTRQRVHVATSLPFPMNYAVELTTTDASNLAVAASDSFVALPSAALAGVNAPYLAPAGKPMTAHFIVADPQGKALAGRAVRLTLVRFDWNDRAKRYEARSESTASATSQSTAVSSTFEPKAPGWYQVRADLASDSAGVSEGDTDVWVFGEGEVDWGASDHTTVPVTLDKAAYSVGDTATALMRSPYADADLYLAVLRGRTFFRTLQHVVGNAPTVSFIVTADMLPGAEVEAVLVRHGTPIEQLPKGSVDSLVRIGSAGFAVKLDHKRLKLAVNPARLTLTPGGQQSVDLHLTDDGGKPVRGQLTVMVADESVLQLTHYRPPDLVDAVYGNWPTTAAYADNRPNAALDQPTPPPIDREGTGTAARFAAPSAQAATMSDTYAVGARELGKVSVLSAPSAPVRMNFQQLAYFNAAVQTDDNGRARVTFKTPDNLTTWRVLVVAEAAGGDATGDAPANYRFGAGDATFTTTLPLLANPLLPQFARPGDLFAGGIQTDNATGKLGQMLLSGNLDGPLWFQLNGRRSRSTSLHVAASAGTQAFRFPMHATAIGNAGVRFRIALGDVGDAFRVPLEIRPLDVTESVIETGATTTSATIPLSVDPNVNNNAGGLQITLASTLLPETVTPAKSCFDFAYLPFTEPLASRLLAAADMRILTHRYGQSVAGIDAEAEAAAALADLPKLQLADGGFAWWPGDGNSNPYLTAYAGEALGQAANAGLHVDPGMVASARHYLEQRLDNPDPLGWCSGQPTCIERMRFEAMQALEAFGEAHEDHLPSVYAVRNGFDLVSRIELARYMTARPAWRKRATAMAAKIQEQVYETGRYAVLNAPSDLWWFDSSTKGQAETVRLYVAQKIDPAVIDRMIRSLLALRRNGAWSNTYDDAQALTALVEYAGLEPELPRFYATANLANSLVAWANFNGYRKASLDAAVATDRLPRKRSDLVLDKRGKGTLHYVVTLSYRLSGPQPGTESGLIVTRDVRLAESSPVVASMGLRKLGGSVSLAVGKVYDIGLTIVADHPVNQVVIVDPLPAGLEAVDTEFVTSPHLMQALADSWAINYHQIYRDRVVAFANYLDPGVYTMHYLARSVTAGTFEWPGSQAFLEYAPEEFGRAASAVVDIR